MATLQSQLSETRYIGVRVEAYEVAGSKNIDNNTTDVIVDFHLISMNNGYGSCQRGNNAQIWVAGQYQEIYVPSWNIARGEDWLVGSVRFTVPHEADGSKWCTVGVSYGTGVSGLGSVSLEGGFQLTTIERASSVGCSDFYIESSTNIVINSASSNFRHTLRYSFGNLSGTIVTKTGQTIYAWTPNADEFYQQVPNSQQGVGVITCETYNNNTLIGTKTCNFTARVDKEKNRPNVSLTVIDVNDVTKALTGNENTLVKYFSNAKATITASAKNSATIKSYQINNVSSEQITTINNVETNEFTAKVIDSREIDNSSEKVTKDFIEYVKLAIKSVDIERTEPTENQVRMNLEGFYFNDSFGAVDNELTVQMRYKEQYGEYSNYYKITSSVTDKNTFNLSDYNLNTLFNANFDYQKAYTFEIVIKDKLMTINQEISLKRGLPAVAYGEDFVHLYGDLELKSGNKVLDYKVIDRWQKEES